MDCEAPPEPPAIVFTIDDAGEKHFTFDGFQFYILAADYNKLAVGCLVTADELKVADDKAFDLMEKDRDFWKKAHNRKPTWNVVAIVGGGALVSGLVGGVVLGAKATTAQRR